VIGWRCGVVALALVVKVRIGRGESYFQTKEDLLPHEDATLHCSLANGNAAEGSIGERADS
jgi:hypothetical protein